ncbi:MAG TPA: BatD family protein [Candidatus Acidoferrales bacterium]|nr:BatD family protein [Candidatus Acidoferrales bacterium]
MKSIVKILAALSFVSSVVSAQTFTASVDNSTVGVDNQFQVSFTFSGKDVNGIKSFNPPDFNGFMVLSGPNQSTSMSIINGAVSASATYSYYLRARNTGKFTIGPAEINYGGKTFTTQLLEVTVIRGQAKQSASSTGNNATRDIGDNLFILATVDKQKVYMGEQVTVTYKLFTRLSIASQLQVSKLPSYEGFWVEEINVPNTISFATQMYDGKQYRVGLLKKVALFPNQLGELSVTPLVLDVPVQVQSKQRGGGDIFDQFFNDPFFNSVQTVNYTARSNTVKLHVIALPSENIPRSFNGAVGDYSLSSQINPTDVKTNEPLTLKINLSGQGNIQLLNMPEVELPPGFDKYEPKTSEQIDRTGTVSGSKSFEYLIVPRVAGLKKISPIQFSYFSPAKRSYVTLSTPAYSINVEEGSGTNSTEIAGYTKEEIKLLGQDIRYIKTSDDDLRKASEIQLFGFGFWTATVVPLFVLGGLVTWKRKQDRLSGNVQLVRYRRAEKIARKRFKTASVLMESNNQAGFYAEISQALFGYLEDKLHIPKSEISLERAVGELQRRNIDAQLIVNLKDCIEKCEFARFAPGGDGKAAMNDMYNELTRVIIGIEKFMSVRKHV